MPVTIYEALSVASAVIAVLMLGSRNVRFQLSMLSIQIVLIASETAIFAYQTQQPQFYIIAFTLFLQRAVIVPVFLDWIVRRVDINTDPGIVLPAPLTMHLSILLFALSFLLPTIYRFPQPVEWFLLVQQRAYPFYSAGS